MPPGFVDHGSGEAKRHSWRQAVRPLTCISQAPERSLLRTNPNPNTRTGRFPTRTYTVLNPVTLIEVSLTMTGFVATFIATFVRTTTTTAFFLSNGSRSQCQGRDSQKSNQ